MEPMNRAPSLSATLEPVNTQSEFKAWAKPFARSEETATAVSGDPLSLAGVLRTLPGGAQRTPMASPATAHVFVSNPLRSGGMMNLSNNHFHASADQTA